MGVDKKKLKQLSENILLEDSNYQDLEKCLHHTKSGIEIFKKAVIEVQKADPDYRRTLDTLYKLQDARDNLIYLLHKQ